MSDSPPTSALAQIRPARADSPIVLLVHQAGRITHANQAAQLLWQTETGGLSGELFSDLFAAGTASNRGEAQADLWLLILGSSLDQEVELVVQLRDRRSTNANAGSIKAGVRVERLSDVIYLATIRSIPEADPVVRFQPVATPEPVAQPVAPAEPKPVAVVDDNNLSPLLIHAPVGFFDLDARTGRAIYSPTWKAMLGYSDTSLPDTIEAWRSLIHPDDSSAAPDRLGKRSGSAPRPFNFEFRMRHHAGHWIWVQSVGVQILTATSELERVIGLNLDVTERKEIEETTLAGDERIELLGSGFLGIFDLDFVHQNFWFSPGWRKILGYRENELNNSLATFLSSLLPGEQTPGVEAWIRARSPDLSNFIGHEVLVGKNGERFPVHFGMQQVLTRKRELARVVGFISPDSQSHAKDTAPAPLVQQALMALAEGVIFTTPTGKIVSINPAACRLLRVKADEVHDQLASQVFRLVHRETGQPTDDPVTRAISATEPLPLLTDSSFPPRSPGEPPQPVIWTARTARDASGALQGVVILFRDPAEISLSADELLKANRLESLGMVAGGIAHDFNDLLTTILGGISLAREKHSPAALEESEKACLSARGLTKQLLTFAKGGSAAHTVMSAEEVFNASTKLALAGSDAATTINIAPGTESVRVDRLQIVQVFQNLIINSLQAMPAAPHRPRVQLRAANATLIAGQIPPLPAGEYVEFEVRDNGQGILPENLEKVFDPFFTTRKHGTGLGLATALSIVRKHGGQIGVVSTLAEGTAFTVFLPRADAPVVTQSQKAPSLRFRTGRILFMDDDPRITALTATMLESLDYKFDVAKNGAEAIQLYQRYFNIGRPYDAVILDVTVVGGMGGEECFRKLRDCDPDVRAIISTGYENDAMARTFLDQGFCGYLAKPYRVADLGKLLKGVFG